MNGIDFRAAQIQAYGSENYYKDNDFYLTKFTSRDVDYSSLVEKNYSQVRMIMELKFELFKLSTQFSEWVDEHDIWIGHFKFLERQFQASMQLLEIYKEELRKRDVLDGLYTLSRGETESDTREQDEERKTSRKRTSFKDRPRRT